MTSLYQNPEQVTTESYSEHLTSHMCVYRTATKYVMLSARVMLVSRFVRLFVQLTASTHVGVSPQQSRTSYVVSCCHAIAIIWKNAAV